MIVGKQPNILKSYQLKFTRTGHKHRALEQSTHM